MDVQRAIDELQNAGANYRCSRMIKILTDLGFKVNDGRKGNHKTFMHPQIPHFHGGDFDCGHGRTPQVKKCYIGNVRKVLEKYRAELEQIN